jgi:hypothetical protein
MNRLARGAWVLLALGGPAGAVGTIFTYQGSLQDAGVLANGAYDLQFHLQTQAGAPVAGPLQLEDVPVNQGVFTVELDFGATIASGDYQLQIGVRPGSLTGAYTALSPPTKLRPAPQAQVAAVASEAVTVTPGSISSGSVIDGSLTASDVDSTSVQRRVSSACVAGTAIASINADGSVSCVASGNLRIYGNGSRGDLLVASGIASLDTANLQFNNITVAAGAALFVPSGATVRALGSVTINGQLSIQDGAEASNLTVASGALPVPVSANYFGNAANSGGWEEANVTGPVTYTLVGRHGRGARAMSQLQTTPAHSAVHPVFVGGGAGGNSNLNGADGGGFVAIVAQGPITIGGVVFATGTTASTNGGSGGGGGGGGGGILVLASRTSIQNTGTINASGGGGAAASSSLSGTTATAWGAGGGGGGGIVHFIAPSISIGTVTVAGGTGGTNGTTTTYGTATDMNALGGGGGGACFGRGGNGTPVNGAGSTRQYTFGGAGQTGDPGLVIQTLADPTTLL